MSSAPALSLTRPASPFWADRLGTWASVLCVVHCLLTPILLSFSVVLMHALPSEEKVHRTLAVLVASLGAIALCRGFRVHRRLRILALMLGGLGCIAAAAAWGDHFPAHRYEVLVTFMGSLLMVTAHRLNHTFCHPCRGCTPQSL